MRRWSVLTRVFLSTADCDDRSRPGAYSAGVARALLEHSVSSNLTQPQLPDSNAQASSRVGRGRKWLGAYSAGLVAVGVISPILTAVTTIVALFSPLALPVFTGSSVVYGFISGVLLWLLAATFCAPLAYPAAANRASYADLSSRVQPMRLKILRWRRESAQGAEARPMEAIAEAELQLQGLDIMLERPGLAWVAGDGYIAAWGRAHRAEEALIGAALRGEVHEEVEHDRVRLNGAVIPQRDELLGFLSEAERQLDAFWFGSRHLSRARAKSKEVRNAINTFRDGGFNGLLRLRNQTMILLFLTAENVYALLALAVVAGAQRDTILSSAGFYLIGAAVGLFSRLYQQTTAAATVEDYGLATARLLTLPVYSGLAGVAGVLLYGLTASIASSGVSTRAIPSLDQLLSVVSNPFGVLLAAAFGAAPDLVLRGLSEVSDKYKAEIVSTQASGRIPA